MTPFHALYTAAELRKHTGGSDRLLPALAAANMEVYPFQIAAAMFALRSPYLKGAILADEGSLGKTYEALLVISQMWYEGKEKILLVVPTPLLRQWERILDDNFSLPYVTVDGDVADFDAPDTIVLTTYDYAAANLEAIGAVAWDVAAFDEAHRLSKCYEADNRAAKLKAAVKDAYKLLLTASPMRSSIMDLYGLIYFINEHAFEEPDEFYKCYFRKPENYHELSNRASYYAFRTLRTQVENYVKIPRRLVVTADYSPTKQEQQLALMLNTYLKKPDKTAFPKMDAWELTLMMNRALSSSPFSFCGLLDSAVGRVREPELVAMAELAAEIKPEDTDKGKALLKAIKLAFTELKRHGANRKAIIFTEHRATLGFLHKLLSDTYKTLAFDGSKSSDFSVIQKFESDAEILITTDIAAEGFNLQFCSFVVNYDLPYNTQTLEQRIMRCHRQGQQNDVVVLNFLTKTNIADVRTLELINKRTAQFDAIVGGSDDVVGNFSDNAVDGLIAAFSETRTKSEIDAAFRETLITNEESNAVLVASAENSLFTTFTKEIADKVTVTPQYVKVKTAEINAKLWKLVKWFFAGKTGYSINEDTRTLHVSFQPQKVFTGAALRRREYSMNDKSLTITSAITRNVIGEILWKGIPESGEVTAENIEMPNEICYYKVSIGSGWQTLKSYYTFAGQSANGEPLTDEQCREIMDLPVIHHTTSGERIGEQNRHLREQSRHELDKRIDTAIFMRRAAAETDGERKDEIDRLTEQARLRKLTHTRDIERLRREIKQSEIDKGGGIADRIDAEKRRAAMTKDIKQREQSVFLDGLKIDAELEEEVNKLTAGLTAKVTRMFAIRVKGAYHNG